MAKYQPLIPTGTIPLDQDYRNLRSNFTALNDVFGVDHTTFDDNTAQKGYHETIHIIPRNNPDNDPNTVTGIGQLYNRVVNDGYSEDTILYFKTGLPASNGKKLQLTSNITPLKDPEGYTFLPGGIIVQWGNLPVAAGNTNATGLNFNIDFKNAIYAIQLTPSFTTAPVADYSLSLGPFTLTTWGYNKRGSNNIDKVYWFAIGS